ncbi:MAG: hypothetical protein A3C35_04950 [Omnitrophica bacterium RIFCSPHIGHO2_02_FULL_46_11]|nr:MAG: hypothetical protein A3C35_04950 [Omnitrophica bacterium RIFCSPHIGHO2_02_FULL_46_11]OGW87783.1 MAG: hypothetical protein A3A81_01640 [Omnitrophica bacterium RIFCSPLOWO2_01_FULL_45_10b]
MLIRILFYLTAYAAILGLIIFFLVRLFQVVSGKIKGRKIKVWRHPKKGLGAWIQVYDTDSWEEAQALQARLEEEEIECFVYEQGRKDVHGTPFKGFGIAVPETSVSRSQKIIARMPA